MKNKIRRAKLHGKYRAGSIAWGSHYRGCDYSGHPGRYVPWLNVNGLWLERAGFNVGDPIEISVKNKELTIKKLAAHGDRRN